LIETSVVRDKAEHAGLGFNAHHRSAVYPREGDGLGEIARITVDANESSTSDAVPSVQTEYPENVDGPVEVLHEVIGLRTRRQDFEQNRASTAGHGTDFEPRYVHLACRENRCESEQRTWAIREFDPEEDGRWIPVGKQFERRTGCLHAGSLESTNRNAQRADPRTLLTCSSCPPAGTWG